MSILKSEIAAVALGKLITENPGNITIICLGPLTNIALAIKLFPTFMDDVKEIYLMGGNHLGITYFQSVPKIKRKNLKNKNIFRSR